MGTEAGGILLVCPTEDQARAAYAADGVVTWSRALPLVLEKHGFLGVELAGPDVLEDAVGLSRAAGVIIAPLPPEAWTEVAVANVLERGVPIFVEAPLPPQLAARVGVSPVGTLTAEGSIVASVPSVRSQAAEYGAAPGASLGSERVTTIQRDPALDWTRLERVPLDDARAEAWRSGWSVEAWTVSSRAALLCEWVGKEPPHPRRPAIVRFEHITVCCFGLSAFLVQRHSIHPLEGPQWLATDRSIGLETILLALLDDMYRRSGAVRLRVLPWPAGRRWARTVRHDVFTAIDNEHVARLAAFNDRGGSRATLFWAPSAATESAALADGKHLEVALCAEQLWGAERGEERAEIEAAAQTPVRGATARGSAHCFRHQGAPNVLWADDEGLLYTELAGRSHAHPHRFPAVAADGLVQPLDVLCLPAPESLAHIAGDAERARETLQWWTDVGGLLQLTTPPGEPDPALAEALAEMSSDDRWDVTTAEAIEWWRRSHVDLHVQPLGGGRFELSSREPIAGLAIEFLQPDGRISQRLVDVGPEPLELSMAPSERPTLISWDDTRPMFRRALRRALDPAAADSDSATVEVRIESTASGRERGDLALRALAELTGRTSLEGARLLDAGCGYGALSLYLGWSAAPRAALGVDLNPTSVGVAATVADEAGLGDLVQFATGELESVPIDDHSVDVAFAVGVLMYMPSARSLRRALLELRRVLDGGGTLYVYQANRWRLRDPMSGRRFTHLLPRSVARRVDPSPYSNAKRWSSPVEMMVQLRLAGYRDMHLESYGDEGRRCTGLRRLADRSYAICATLPGRPCHPHRLPIKPLSQRPQPEGWDELESVIRAEIVAGLRDAAGPADGDSRRRLIRAETVLVPERARVLFNDLEELVGIRTLAGRTVVEMGSGFGGLAVHLALAAEPTRLIAVDPDGRALEGLTRIAALAGLADSLEPHVADLESLEGVADGVADVVVANGSLSRLEDEVALEHALRAARRVLRDGGSLLIYDITTPPPGQDGPAADLAAGGELTAGWTLRPLDPEAVGRSVRAHGFTNVNSRMHAVDPDLLQDPSRPAGFLSVGAQRRG